MVGQYLPHTNEKCYSTFQLHFSHLNTARVCLVREKFTKSEAEKYCSTFFYVVNIVLSWFISQRTSKLCNKLFCLHIFSVSCMRHLLYLMLRHLLYLMFRCDFDVTENLETLEELNTALMSLSAHFWHEREGGVLWVWSLAFELASVNKLFLDWPRDYLLFSSVGGHPAGQPLHLSIGTWKKQCVHATSTPAGWK